MNCKECKFWSFVDDSDADYGECRYNPPFALVTHDSLNFDMYRTFPETYSDDWCGKFTSKIEKESTK